MLRNEGGILEAFFEHLGRFVTDVSRIPVIVAHHASFDVDFIWQRAVVHGIKPPTWWPVHPQPWSPSVFDTMTAWGGPRGRISLDKLCRALGLPGKGDVDGSMVVDMIREGRVEEVAAYCGDDVEKVVKVHRKLVFGVDGATGLALPPGCDRFTMPDPDTADVDDDGNAWDAGVLGDA